MSNTNSVTTYASSTGKTTVSVIDFFNSNDVPGYGNVKAAVLVKFAAETLMNPSGTAVQLNIPVFSAVTTPFAPIWTICECITALTQGGTSTSTTLTQTYTVSTTPSTLAIVTGTTNPTKTAINATGTTRGTTVVGIVAASGTATLAAGQIQTDPFNLTSTRANAVLPGETLFISFLPSGTLTTSTTYTGIYKFYILGNGMTASNVAI